MVVGWLFIAQAVGAASPSALSVASQSDWRQWRGGADHRGVNRYESTLSVSNVSNLQLQFVGNNGFNSSPAVAGGVMYVSNGGLHAYPADCASDGSVCPPLWTGGSNYADWSSPAVGGGAGLHRRRRRSVCLQGRLPLGRRPMLTALERPARPISGYTSPTFADGIVYITTNVRLPRTRTTFCLRRGRWRCAAPKWTANLGGERFQLTGYR